MNLINIQNHNKYNMIKPKLGYGKNVLHKELFNCDYFRVAIIGPSGSGKSFALYNILNHVIFNKPKLIIVSNTI